MTKRKMLSVALLLLLTGACDSPSSPSDPLNVFNWTLDGQSFRSSGNGMSALDRGGGNLAVAGTVCQPYAAVNLDFVPPVSVGTHPSGRVTAIFFNSVSQWQYSGRNPAPGSSGSVTLTSVSPRLAGSFSFQLAPASGSNAGGIRSIQGNFDLSFDDKKICE